MADQRLIDYIRDNMQRGYSADYLMQILLDQGWDINEINEAINAAHGYPPSPSQPQAPPFQTQQATTKPAQQSGPPSRPRGVTVICVLGFLSSVLMLLGGVLIVFLGQLFGQIIGSLPLGNETFPFLGNQTGFMGMGGIDSLFGSAFGFLGIIFIVLAIVDFVGFYLLWKMKKIGWIIITLVGIITIILSLMSFSINNILAIVLVAVIIGYMLTKRKLFV